MPHILLAVGFLLAGCSLFGDEQEDQRTTSARATDVSVFIVEGRTVRFDYVGWVPDPCWDYDHLNVDQQSFSVFVDLRYRRDESAMCAAVATAVEQEISVQVPTEGMYTFRFPSGPDETLDVDVLVP